VTDEDPERLLAEALRAQATRAPSDTAPVGYGLLSGSDVKVPLPKVQPPSAATTRIEQPPRQVPALLILLLALLLGLAAGAVVGLLTLI
jgi:hypothetical protein